MRMRRRKNRTPYVLARIFEAAVILMTVLMITLAGGVLLLHLFGVQTYIVMSGSMEPQIKTGAIALIDTTDRDVTVGDIAAYRLGEDDEEILITHRVIGRRDGFYIMKGDANDSEDEKPVDPDQIVGTFIGSVPKAGYAVDTLGKRGLFGIVLWITSLNILSSLLRDITYSRYRRSNRRRGRRSPALPDNYRRT